MRRQFRVTDSEGFDTLVNVEFTGGTVTRAVRRAANELAGATTNARYPTLIPVGWEMTLPFDQVPVTVPCYPLPTETHRVCAECQRLFLVGATGIARLRLFCSRTCGARDRRRKERP
jgi:hypothetical protein